MKIGIIGGGFSGTLVLANLVRQTTIPLEVHWFERHAALAEGVAYGTKDMQHLLNVRADRMGAFAGQPEDFWQWLQTQDYAISAEDFAPRAVYARYLHHILQDTLARATQKQVTIHRHRAEVEEVDTSLVINRHYAVDVLVLATGNGEPQTVGVAGKNYIGNIWEAAEMLAQVKSLPADSEIAIIGTGLTTVDTILSLLGNGYKGKIAAVSRNGLFPLPHAPATPYPAWSWVQHPEQTPRTVLGLMRGLRAEVRRAQSQGYDWRAVVDSLRPVTQTLWRQLDDRQKSLFFRRAFTLWNVHRHRMAPQLHTLLQQLMADGVLHVFSRKNPYDFPRASLVINCTGPNYSLSDGQPLFARLAQENLISPGALDRGIRRDESRGVYAIGPLLLGEYLECTAVPELRDRAKQIATDILAASQR